MSRRIFALFLALCLILTAAPISVGAATGQQVTAGAVTVTAGNTASVTLRAENFVNLAALDVYIYYDPAIFTVSSTGNGSMLSGAQTSVNTAEAGKITLSMMSLNGISGSGNLITVYFNTGADTEPGTYPITVAIGRAYDSSLQPVTVSGVSGSVTVNKPVETQSFRVYNYMTLENNPLQKGDTLTCKIANLYGYYFVSGEFTLEYDHEMFVLESVELDSRLLGEGAVYSVNSSVLGQVRLAYANAEPVNSFYMFTVKLKVIADADTTTTVKAQASNVYRADLSPYLPDSVSGTVTLKKSPHVADHPDAFFRTEDLEVGRQNKSVFCLEAGAGVAAADFTLTYDPTVLRCVNVVMAEGLEDLGGMLVINDNYAAGSIRFSYVNMSAYDAEDLPLVEITWEPLRSPQTHYEILSGAVGIVDEKQNPITLEYVTDSGCILAPVITAPTCTEGGYTSHTCAACGDSYVDSETDSLGHTEEVIPPTAPTCTETGLTEGKKCSVCGETLVAQQSVDALGHSEEVIPAVAPTCTETGLTEGKKCSVCGETLVAQQSVDALGHTEEVIPAVAPTCTETGLTEGKKCSVCGVTLVAQQTVDALGHSWVGNSCENCGIQKGSPFVDVAEGQFYYNPVMWAVANGITYGVDATHFGPSQSCTRAHVVTFLWRAAGSPEPASGSNPFTDVAQGSFYYKAVLWAVEKGITAGTSATTFSPNAECTRGQIVTFLWRSQNKPAVSGSSIFTDVAPGTYYHDAVLWAVANGITNGMGEGIFAPNATCNRGQVVTFLYRAYSN